MTYFLAKTEPGVYSISDLERDKTTTWDGVTNPQAVNAIKSMKSGDRVLIYHSGGESQIVGVAEVASAPKQDPKNPKSWVVDLKFHSKLDEPTTLAEIKATHEFDSWALVRQGRLSTMSIPDEFVSWLRSRHRGAKL